MNQLDEQGRNLLSFLVKRLSVVKPKDPRTFVGYKDAHLALGLSMQGPSYGISLRRQGLDSLADWTVRNRLPSITGLIIDQERMAPGSGYFKLLGVPDESYKAWESEIAKAKTFDWAPYLTDSGSETLAISSEYDSSHRQPVVWRLIAHHENAVDALVEMERRNLIAVGWTDTGDLHSLKPQTADDIGKRIRETLPEAANSGHGGASLWNLYTEVSVGDIVLVTAGPVRKVFEVVGEYFFAADGQGVLGYQHQRAAVVTSLDGDELWKAVGGKAAQGDSIRWTLVRCSENQDASDAIFREGRRFEVHSTAIERNPKARAACIQYHGVRCFACGFDFEERYGSLGRDFIHVHHRSDIALSNGSYEIDPVKHLIPLCPNCHAMVHRQRPAMAVEELRGIIEMRGGNKA